MAIYRRKTREIMPKRKRLGDLVQGENFLDVIMQMLIAEYGEGEILDYLTIEFQVKADKELDAIHADYTRVSELLAKACDAIPPIPELDTRRQFGDICKAHDDGFIFVIQRLQEYVDKATMLDKDLLCDMMQIVIAEHFDIEEDQEKLREKYGYSIFDQIAEQEKDVGYSKHRKKLEDSKE